MDAGARWAWQKRVLLLKPDKRWTGAPEQTRRSISSTGTAILLSWASRCNQHVRLVSSFFFTFGMLHRHLIKLGVVYHWQWLNWRLSCVSDGMLVGSVQGSRHNPLEVCWYQSWNSVSRLLWKPFVNLDFFLVLPKRQEPFPRVQRFTLLVLLVWFRHKQPACPCNLFRVCGNLHPSEGQIYLDRNVHLLMNFFPENGLCPSCFLSSLCSTGRRHSHPGLWWVFSFYQH